MSQLTTHILDTTKGQPAKGVPVTLYQQQGNEWPELVKGQTNDDGRIPHFLEKDRILEPGVYMLRFDTGDYFDKQGTCSFYPFIEIIFSITGSEHYHVPLLLSPFGYSTYRGS